MPGFVAVFPRAHSDADVRQVASDVFGGLSRIGSRVGQRLSGYGNADVIAIPEQSREVRLTPGLRFVQNTGDEAGFLDQRDFTLAWVGNPRQNSRLLGADPDALIAAMQSEAALCQWAQGLRGQFQILLHHKSTNRTALIVDRVSTLPAYYTHHDGVVVAPEPLAFANLAPHGWSPQTRNGAIFEDMASGHLLEDGCWWNEVRRLGPGQILWVEEGESRCLRYWEMRPTPTAKPAADRVAELQAAIDQDCQAIPPGKAILTLSGGYDSRALLGMLKREGRDFETVSYSLSDEYDRDFDETVGSYFAGKLGVRHTCYVVAPPSVDSICEQMWLAIAATGGECDNVVTQDAFLGAKFYTDLANRFDYLLRGDECWGWGDFVLTSQMALWQVMLLRLDQIAPTGRFLTKSGWRQGNDYLSQRHAEILADAPGGGQRNDAKDFLYWRHRETRLLQNMAQYRHMFLPHYAPFLFGNSLEVVRGLPVGLRCRKHLFRQTMEQQFPELFCDSKMPTSLRPRVSRIERLFREPEFLDFARDLLVERVPAGLGNLLDRSGMKRWIADVATPRQGKSTSARRYDSLRSAYDVLRKNRYMLATVTATMAATNRLKSPIVECDYLFRILCLAMTLRTYEGRLSTAQQAKQPTCGDLV